MCQAGQQLELVKRPQNKPRQLWYVDMLSYQNFVLSLCWASRGKLLQTDQHWQKVQVYNKRKRERERVGPFISFFLSLKNTCPTSPHHFPKVKRQKDFFFSHNSFHISFCCFKTKLLLCRYYTVFENNSKILKSSAQWQKSKHIKKFVAIQLWLLISCTKKCFWQREK